MARTHAIGRPRGFGCIAATLVFAGISFANGTPPARALDDRTLRVVYLDLVGRPPFANERSLWRGKTFDELLSNLVPSSEFWNWWLEEQLYYFLLIDNFRPETPRVAALPDDLANDKLDVREAIHRIALSPSFDQRNPGADTFVTVVMEQLDGLVVQKNPRELEIAKKIYDGASGSFLGKNGKCQADIVEIAIGHELFAKSFLSREFKRWMRADPDPRELAEWVKSFQTDARIYPSLVRGWFASPAFEKRLAQRSDESNRLYVRALLVDLLGRTPSEDELRRMRTALDGLSDPAPLRSVVARMVLDSKKAALPEKKSIAKPSEWIDEQFRRTLGRAPSERELASFLAQFADDACRPATILCALVSSPEYSTN